MAAVGLASGLKYVEGIFATLKDICLDTTGRV